MLEKVNKFKIGFEKVIGQKIQDYYHFLNKLVSNNYDKIIEIAISIFLIVVLYYLVKFLISQIIKITIKIRAKKNIELYKERIITLASVFRSILKILALFSIILFILKEFNIQIIPIITGAGVLGAAIVFSFQGIIQDIIRGWILIFEDHARKGEWVNINNTFIGKIIDFDLRGMVILDRERNFIFLPNSQINTIANLSRQDKKFFISIKFNREVDLNKQLEIIDNFLESKKNSYSKIYDLKLEERFNITPDYYEIFISFKTKFALGEYYLGRVKIDLIKEFKNQIREIS